MTKKHLKPGQLFTFEGHVYQIKVLDPSILQHCLPCTFCSIFCSIFCPNIHCISPDGELHYYFKLIK